MDSRAPRVLASRTIFVAETTAEAYWWAESGLRAAVAASPRTFGSRVAADAPLAELLAVTDSFVGSPQQVAESAIESTGYCRYTPDLLAINLDSDDRPLITEIRAMQDKAQRRLTMLLD